MDVTEDELQTLYSWVDEIPLSRPKKNIARDFSDGVLLAEVVGHYFPRLVELHNYSSANGMQQKLYNWNTLNQKVFKRMGFQLSKQECEAIANCKPGTVERVLKLVQNQIMLHQGRSEEEAFPCTFTGEIQRLPSTSTVSTIGAARKQSAALKMPQGIPAYMPAALATRAVVPEALAEKEMVIAEMRETNEILETKVRKLEQLVKLKDAKIQTLMAKLQASGLA